MEGGVYTLPYRQENNPKEMNNSIKKLIEESLIEAAREIKKKGILWESLPPIFISPPKKEEWGDLFTNFPFLLSQTTGESASKIGRLLASLIKDKDFLSQVEFVPPGWINFFISPHYLEETVKKVITQEKEFTCFSEGQGKKIQVEFVSANPTGPLHIGHGRAAAFGDSLANILSKIGYTVEREYYINDMGGQINRLSSSVLARLRQLQGKKSLLPEGGYKGEYLIEIARKARDRLGELAENEDERQLLNLLGEFAVREILKGIEEDLDGFGVKYNTWFTESNLYREKEVVKTISLLKDKGYVYEREGALWFRTSLILKNEEDRVLRRRNGEYTYFAADIAYHQNKFSRGFDRVIDIWGADHTGYVPRLKAAVQALGYPQNSLEIIIYQLVSLVRDGKKVSASTREGEFIPLKEVVKEVGKDACRFFFLSRTCDSHLDFDLELAKKQTSENPVFYVQYAYARICSIFKKAEKEGVQVKTSDRVRLSLLTTPEERKLMKHLALLPDQIREAAESLEPHRLTTFLKEISTVFHQFYTQHRVINEDKELTSARLLLIKAVKIAIEDVLDLLGISAPHEM